MLTNSDASQSLKKEKSESNDQQEIPEEFKQTNVHQMTVQNQFESTSEESKTSVDPRIVTLGEIADSLKEDDSGQSVTVEELIRVACGLPLYPTEASGLTALTNNGLQTANSQSSSKSSILPRRPTPA